MKRVFLVFGNEMAHVSIKNILGSGKGMFSLFCEQDCPTSAIDDVLKMKDSKSKYQVSQMLTGMSYTTDNDTVDSESLFAEMVNAGTENVVLVLEEKTLDAFLPLLQAKLGSATRRDNHFTCEVAQTKFAALANTVLATA